MKNKSEKPQTNKDQFSEKPTEDKTVTRRNFIKNTAIAGAGAAAILQNESSQAQTADPLNIKIPKEIPQTLAEAAKPCLLYTSPSPRDRTRSRMPSSA